MNWMCRLLCLVPLALGLTQCSSLRPQGENPQQQREFIDAEAAKIMTKLAKQSPDSNKDLAEAEGYAAFTYTASKLPIVLGGIGAGAGYGVAVDNADDARTYMKIQKLNWGVGIGVRGISVVFVFSDREVFDKFRKGKWDGGASAEATAKTDDAGVGVGGVASVKKGFKAYTLTDAGISYGVTYQTRRFSPISSLNR